MAAHKVFLFVLLAIVIFLLPGSVLAASTPHQNKAEQLLVLIGVPGILDQTSSIAVKVYLDQDPQLKKYSDILKRFTRKYTSWDHLKTDFINLYTEQFTEEELENLINFYSTPTGKKALALMPSLMNQTSLIVQKAFQDNAPQLDKMINDRDQEIHAEAENLLKLLD